MATATFDIEVAREVGTDSATLFYGFCYWIQLNTVNERNFEDGKYWTYNSLKAVNTLYPFLTAKQVRLCIDKLVSRGFLEKSNHNKSVFDRTAWYTIGENPIAVDAYNRMRSDSIPPKEDDAEDSISQKGKSICPKRQMTIAQKGTPIPINNTINNTVNNEEKIQKESVDYELFKTKYNEICKSMPRCTVITELRKNAINARLKDYDKEKIFEVFRLAEKSDFLSGRNGEWAGCNFDWLLRPTNFVKVLEGSYKNGKKKKFNHTATNEEIDESFEHIKDSTLPWIY